MLLIRAAQIEDSAAIAALSGALGYPADRQVVSRRLGYVLEDSGHLVLVAEDAGQNCVGWIHLFVAFRVESDPFVEIGGLVVDPANRRLGIGSKLVQAGINWAKEKGIGKVRVRTNSVREEAGLFYRQMGFSLSKNQDIYDIATRV
ncbi:MAG TPA: GNAT family N-acetyltransferase [Calditrichia bacterium]|nr:GNAT family N-acetyltransferase [Calditrichota bacterium]HQU73760.1 GNAT family N-acetyltransferase [Calditrichia bacterium]HQV30615.1 GNAT family N-acetyltransferase [Calditrichia bacterium]